MEKKYYLLSLVFVFFVSVFGQSDNDQDYVDGNQREFIGPKFISLNKTNEILSNSQSFDTTKNIKNAQIKNFSSSIERIKKERNSQRLGSLTKNSQGQITQNSLKKTDKPSTITKKPEDSSTIPRRIIEPGMVTLIGVDTSPSERPIKHFIEPLVDKKKQQENKDKK